MTEIQSLEQNIADLREQLTGLWDALATASEDDEIRLKQKIRKRKKKLAEFDREYWQLVSQVAPTWSVDEADAELIQGEIVEGINRIEELSASEQQTEMLELLKEIRAQLNKPGSTAAGKLKGVISSMPPFIELQYHAELDTEKFFKTYFPTFRSAITRIARLNAKK